MNSKEQGELFRLHHCFHKRERLDITEKDSLGSFLFLEEMF